MPYYIYKIHGPLLFEYLDQKSRFKEAKALIKELRNNLATNGTATIRMVFAHSTEEAERLLSTPQNQDHRVIGED
ncbi:hypothetical protein TI03_00215 [Achromatium sp. WMS1]|nr:hypothetical protein TI03_00215 [Achromatium sp. WMS1]